MSANTCDLVVFGSVLTPAALDGEARAEFIAMSGDRILAVGDRSEGDEWAKDAAQVIDVGSATITAGLVDAHIHPIAGYDMTRGVDLTGLRTRDAVREALRGEVERAPEGWVYGWGLDPTAFEGGEWSTALLDGIADGRLVHITFFDAHASLVSAEALAQAGVTGGETFGDSASVGVDGSGRPTGVLLENSAVELVRSLLPAPSREDRVDALADLLAGMAASGLTGGQMLDLALPDSLEILEELERRADLPIHLRVSPWVMPGSDEATLSALAEMQGRHGRRWYVRGIKLMIDGTVDNGTAWLFEPDSQGQSTASLWLDPAEYTRALAYFDARGIPTTTHAIGDQGVSFVARSIRDSTSGTVVHRIEHIETLPDAVLAEVLEAGASTSMQPTHCTHFVLADGSDNWSKRLGDQRAGRGWRIRDLRDAGVTVALGSDWPIAPFDPRAIMASAQLRRPSGQPDVAPVVPAQAISAVRALEGYTTQYWRSVGEPGGVLEPGGRADLSVFDLDPLTADPDAFAEAKVLLTVLHSEVVVNATSDPPVGIPQPDAR